MTDKEKIDALAEALENFKTDHKKNAENSYFLQHRRIAADMVIECACELCEKAEAALKAERG